MKAKKIYKQDVIPFQEWQCYEPVEIISTIIISEPAHESKTIRKKYDAPLPDLPNPSRGPNEFGFPRR